MKKKVVSRKGPKPKIVERKLGKEKCWGQAVTYTDRRRKPTVEVDPRLSPRRQIEVFCHEALHIALPGLTDHPPKSKAYQKGEAEIDRIGKVVSGVLWDANYRRMMLSKHTTPVRISPKPKLKIK